MLNPIWFVFVGMRIAISRQARNLPIRIVIGLANTEYANFCQALMWSAISHIISAVINFSTIIGIPFGIQHLKLAVIALAPIGQTIVTTEVADAARRANAETWVDDKRRR